MIHLCVEYLTVGRPYLLSEIKDMLPVLKEQDRKITVLAKIKSLREVIYIHIYIIFLSASGKHGQRLTFAFSALSQVHGCAVGTIGTPPRPLYQVGLPVLQLLGALALTAHSCPW